MDEGSACSPPADDNITIMATAHLEKLPLLEAQDASTEQSLAALREDARRAHQAYAAAWARSPAGRWHRRVACAVTLLMLWFGAACAWFAFVDDSLPGFEDAPWAGEETSKVRLEAHIMSKCPDARDCLHDMILPAMMKVADKVDFTLSFIGSSTHHDDGVACKHGPEECLGNLLELCAAHLYPDPKIYLGFTMCLSREYADIPSRGLVDDCALEHAIDVDRLNACAVDASGALSVGLLQKSFRRSAAANVTTSCTVRLNDEVRCVRDDGRWIDCEGGHRAQDLVDDILKLDAAASESSRWW